MNLRHAVALALVLLVPSVFQSTGVARAEDAPPPLNSYSITPAGPPAVEETPRVVPYCADDQDRAKTFFDSALKEFKKGRHHLAYTDALDTFNRFPDTPYGKRALFLAARSAAADKDVTTAKKLFDESMEKYPALADYSLYLLAKLYSDTGDPRSAVKTYQRLAREYPDSPLAKEGLFSALEATVELREYSDSVRESQRLLEMDLTDSQEAKARYFLTKSLLGLGELDKAAVEYWKLWLGFPESSYSTKAIDIADIIREKGRPVKQPTFADYSKRADRLLEKSYNKAAAHEYELALRAAADDRQLIARIELKLGLCYFRSRDYNEAGRDLESALSVADKPDEASEALYLLARTYLRTDDFPRFEEAALTCGYYYPESDRAVDCLYYVASEYVQSHDYDTAVSMLEYMLETYPNSRRADEMLWMKGWASYQGGRFDDAEKSYAALIGRYPGSTLVPQALYWRARSLKALGFAPASEAALARLRDDYGLTYYGLLAGGTIKAAHGGASGHKAGKHRRGQTHVVLRATSEDKAVGRAVELNLQDMRPEAIREVRRLEKEYGKSADGIRRLTALYSMFEEYRRPMLLATSLYGDDVKTGLRGVPDDMAKALFPVGYWDVISSEADAYGLDPYLLCGVIREESSFDPYAVSPAGAMGLMQVMPDTAGAMCRKVEKERKMSVRDVKETFNVPLGACYLDSLIAKHGGRLAYVLAEYNAGPRPLARWKARTPDATDDEFVENIGYAETRNYVKRVLRNYQVYKALYGKKGP